mmetsp:Transcript_20901/g.51249  ORF Transcript_20901/g.51249 Transcript_20901/m.51249 type:complete len:259 (+) Transcript_20901:1467-2243(+)
MHPRAAPDGTIGQVRGEHHLVLEQVHDVPEELGRVGGAAPVQLGHRGAVHVLRERQHLGVQLVEAGGHGLVHDGVVALALGGQHVLPSSGPDLGGGLARELRHRRGEHHTRDGVRVVRQHLRGQLHKPVLLRVRLPILTEDVLQEGLQQGLRIHVQALRVQVLVHVEVGEEGDRPGPVPGHVVDVHRAPVRGGVRGDHAAARGQGLSASLADVRLRRGEVVPVPVLQGDLSEALPLAVAGIQVPDGEGRLADLRRHAP